MSGTPQRMAEWVGLIVQLNREIRTVGGDVYPAGSYWRVWSHHRGRLALIGGHEDLGHNLACRPCVRKIRREYVSIVRD